MIWWILAIVVVFVIAGLFGDARHSEEPYDGLIGSPGWKRLKPRAYVVYPACEAYPHETRSIDMPVGNARDYAKIFGGKVVLI